MKVFVIMANDFPQGVMDSELKATLFCEAANAAEIEAQQKVAMRARIYYRSYEFEIGEPRRVR